jgi:putative glycosyltransferase (TIGR04372 family)
MSSLSQGWINRNTSELKEGGATVFARKLRHAPIWLVNGLWAVPLVLLIRILRPIILIRIGTLNSSRIGHFVADGAEQLARLQKQPSKTVDWFWLGKPCNTQWEHMICRALPVHSWAKYVDWWNRAIPGGDAHMRPSSYTGSRDVEGMYARYDVKIPFLPGETEKALSWLRSKGWSDGEPFVCLLVRDAEYLANDPIHGTARQRAALDWSYHDYRDSDIDTYVPAIQWLAAQGVWVIRMGKLMAKPLPTGMGHVIDYAFDEGKSDLLDVWLLANCNGCISTGTGPDIIATLYGAPVLFVNFLPLGDFCSYASSVTVPKNLRWTKGKQPLSILEHLSKHFLYQIQYKDAGVDVVELAPEEITLAFQEFWERCINTWQEGPLDSQRQEVFWDTLRSWSEYPRRHGWRHQDARIGAAWLRSVEQTVTSSGHVAGDVKSLQKGAG